ncbi:PREDICTED: peroxidase 10 [Tarenaya hassleriana]|uniref:peroxidase 10 n=1 Tax=Tarenaya hassleriana TaxID=28532 RepID=UPI00053C2C06|nr:PREDICTED: peroxidase 10 [Tarenaya hassleriana]
MVSKAFSYLPAIFTLLLVHVSSFPSGYNNNGGYNIDNNGLTYRFYDISCPNLQMTVRSGVWKAFRDDSRVAASLLRLHFHDCFVNGCDGSILLDETEEFKGEKNAFPNRNSVRGYEVIDAIKAQVEKSCPLTVSCADLVALAAREAVVLTGGPFWPVPLGRRDSTTADEQAANTNLPSPLEPLENITAKFVSMGLDFKDVVVLSGAHTIGFAQCFVFKNRLFNFRGSGQPDPNLAVSVLTKLQDTCPNVDSSNSKLAPLDVASSVKFDNAYYVNLMKKTGLLESDQILMNDPKSAALVKSYSENPYLFMNDFAVSMVKMGSIGVLTGNDGIIRAKCGLVN